jgi:hypothetical protein
LQRSYSGVTTHGRAALAATKVMASSHLHEDQGEGGCGPHASGGRMDVEGELRQALEGGLAQGMANAASIVIKVLG